MIVLPLCSKIDFRPGLLPLIRKTMNRNTVVKPFGVSTAAAAAAADATRLAGVTASELVE